MAKSVWHDLYPDDPGKVAQMETRANLMMASGDRIREQGWNGRETAQRLGITAPQASDLMNGKVSKFSVDALVRFLEPLGLAIHVDRIPA